MNKFIQNHLLLQNAILFGCCAKLPPGTYSRFRKFHSISNVIGNTRKFGHVNSPVFKPKKVVILSRITRYEFEKIRYKNISEEDFKSKVS